MTTYVVTGSRPQVQAPYTKTEEHNVCAALDAFLRTGDSLVTGGAIGIDALAMQHAHSLGVRVVTFLPRDYKFTAKETVKWCSDEVIETGVGYWARDELEVERGDKVLAFPIFERERSSPRSGTWHTWDIALRYRKHCALLVLRPRQGPLMTGPEWRRISEALSAQLPLF